MSSQGAGIYREGQVVTGYVERTYPFGVHLRLPDGTLGYVRRRELTPEGTVVPQAVVSVGQEVTAVVVTPAGPGRTLELSVRRAAPDPWALFQKDTRQGDTVSATVKRLAATGAYLQILPGVDGFLPLAEMAPWRVQKPDELLWVGDEVEAMVTRLDGATRQVRLSIRRQLAHSARVDGITRHLQLTPSPLQPPLELGETEVEPEVQCPVDLGAVGRVLVLDDHRRIREELVLWLQRHGCAAEGVECPAAAVERLAQAEFGVAIVDLDLAGEDGLQFIRLLREVRPATRVLVMSIPEWIAERSLELAALDVVEVFAKPLDLSEILETIGSLARGEKVGPFRPDPGAAARHEPFRRLLQTMRGPSPVMVRLEAGLEDLVRHTGADLAVLFGLDPSRQLVRVVARAGELTINQAAVYGLTASPVKDLIAEGGEVFEVRAAGHARKQFEKLLDAVRFQSCVGVPISVAGRVEHALFLFNRDAGAFTRHCLRDAHAMAVLLGVALESQALEEKIREASPFLVSGQLAAGFGHDVFNKMSALELQVLNLRAERGGLPMEELAAGEMRPTRAPAPCQVLDNLLETVLDLKDTVRAFRELVRAESDVAVEVNSVVERAALLLQSTARRARVQIDLHLGQGLPPVDGSPVRLQQAFLNVMLNAIQHVGFKMERWPEGAARLTIHTEYATGAERLLCVRFGDTGPGIHKRLWDSIFALGFSTRPGGTGLGLYVAQSLLQSMGGRVLVERSLIPAGTIFRVELPVKESWSGGND